MESHGRAEDQRCPATEPTPRRRHSHYFAGHVEQDGDHGRAVVPVDDEAHLLQPRPEVTRVLRQLPDPLYACGGKKKTTTPHFNTRLAKIRTFWGGGG